MNFEFYNLPEAILQPSIRSWGRYLG